MVLRRKSRVESIKARPDFVWHFEAVLKRKKEKYWWVKSINDFLKHIPRADIERALFTYVELEKLERLREVLGKYPKEVRGELYNIVCWVCKKKRYAMPNEIFKRVKEHIDALARHGKARVAWEGDEHLTRTDVLIKWAGKTIRSEVADRIAKEVPFATLLDAVVRGREVGIDKLYPDFFSLLEQALSRKKIKARKH